jgi:hypothetical protein
LISFCFWPFSLFFFPPLSPMVYLLWYYQPYFRLSGTCVPHDECYQKYAPKASAEVATVRLAPTAEELCAENGM